MWWRLQYYDGWWWWGEGGGGNYTEWCERIKRGEVWTDNTLTRVLRGRVRRRQRETDRQETRKRRRRGEI